MTEQANPAGGAGVALAAFEALPLIARASSETPEKRVWTELALHYAAGAERPFVAIVYGRVREGPQGMVPRYRWHRAGTLDAAIAWFEDSALRERLVDAIPDDPETLFPDTNASRSEAASRARASRHYDGPDRLADALAWLYPESADWSRNAIALRVEQDFGVARRNVVNALNAEEAGERPVVSWIAAFVRALRFFDRKLFRIAAGLPAPAERETADVG